tara:strand:- start:699 stop:1052 length:354 start_codon:yes stop_codon:yes gene_type:complete
MADCPWCKAIDEILGVSKLIDNIQDGDALEVAASLAGFTPAGKAARLAKGALTVAPTPAQAKAAVRVATPAAKAANRKLSAALTQVNKTARLKSGQLRKGWTQSKVMKKAHALAKKM